jgi:hypothetical protein
MATGTSAPGSVDVSSKPEFKTIAGVGSLPLADPVGGKAPRLSVAEKRVLAASLSNGLAVPGEPAVVAAVDDDDSAERFDAVVRKAGLTPQKLAKLFRRPESASSHLRVAKLSVPAPERFAAPAPVVSPGPQMLLAFADPTPGGEAGAALSKLLAPAEEDFDETASLEADDDYGDDGLLVPDFADTPDAAPLPGIRPGAKADVPVIEKPSGQRNADKPAISRDVDDDDEDAPKSQALARPDPSERRSSGGGIGSSLRGLFGGGTRAGGGVAVYDISAAKVYMPDGSVLEAHSGIGKMADNPRYVAVKMNGPTPPHTYNLKMRETRFHGVEAIRMLPVDGVNRHGRTGLLTHSYLLRGGRAESHGCVAFKDYSRFLTAFKQGKVKQLVVVPSGGRATILASAGKRI